MNNSNKQNVILLLSIFLFIFSIAFFVQNLEASSNGCFFCIDPGCYQASGTGWTVCEPGNTHCALGGDPCCSHGDLCDN